MYNSRKALFLPLHDRILNLENGYVSDSKTYPELTDNDIFVTKKRSKPQWRKSKTEKILANCIKLLLLPFFIVAALFRKFDTSLKGFDKLWDNTTVWLFKHDIVREVAEKYKSLQKEDVPKLLEHCKKLNVRVFLYVTDNIRIEKPNLDKINSLKAQGLISEFLEWASIEEMQDFIRVNDISVLNSNVVVKNNQELAVVKKIGFGKSVRAGIFVWKIFGEKVQDNFQMPTVLSRIIESIVPYHVSNKKDFYDKKYVIFLPHKNDKKVRRYLEQNLEYIEDKLREKGMELIYYPKWIKQFNPLQATSINFLKAFYPVYNNLTNVEVRMLFTELFSVLGEDVFYRVILKGIGLPTIFPKSCFLVREESMAFARFDEYWLYPINEERAYPEIEEFLRWVRIPEGKVPSFSLSLFKEYDAEGSFKQSTEEELEQIKAKIKLAKKNNNFGILAEATLYLLDIIKQNKPELAEKLQPYLEKNQYQQIQQKLSPLLIDKHKKIFLPGYGNIEIRLHPLAKAVYFLFLRYPDGINFKDLIDYKDELRSIYNTLTNKGEVDDIETTLDELLDARKPNISIQCSRIRAAFKKHLAKPIAKNYYIDGQRRSPKKISLSRELIIIQ